MTTNVWKFIAIGAVTFFGIEHLILCAGMVGLAFFPPSYPKHIELTYHGPDVVKAGDSFTLVFDVYNTGESSRTIDSIQIPHGYLDRVDIVKITPKPREKSFESLGDVLVYPLNRRIAAGKHTRVEIQAKADEPGTYFGVVEVWMSAGITGNCFGVPIRTVVNKGNDNESSGTGPTSDDSTDDRG